MGLEVSDTATIQSRRRGNIVSGILAALLFTVYLVRSALLRSVSGTETPGTCMHPPRHVAVTVRKNEKGGERERSYIDGCGCHASGGCGNIDPPDAHLGE